MRRLLCRDGSVQVDAGFRAEYSDGDPTCPEAHASLARLGQAATQELTRAVESALGISLAVAVATALAVVDGAA